MATKRVTKKVVDRAAADYQRQIQLYGPANLATSRALGKWQELTAAYEKQTGRPLYRLANPGRRKRTLLAGQVEAIEYRHAWDGLPYRHDFTAAGTRAYLHGDGTVEIENQEGKNLWDFYKGQPFLINHPKGARAMARRKTRKTKKANRPAARRRSASSGGKKKRPVPAGFRSWKEYMASIRPGGSRRRSARRRSNPTEGGELAKRQSNPKRRRRSSSRARGAARRYSSRRRRNPPAGFSVRGITGRVQEGVMNGAAVTAGKVAVRAIPAAANLPATGFAGIAVQAGIAVGASMVTDRIIGRRYGPYVLAGGFSAVLESLLKKANLPVISASLGDEYDLLAAYPLSMQLAAYPSSQGGSGMGAYPQNADSYVEE